MRSEFVVVLTLKNGKKDVGVFNSMKYAEPKFEQLSAWAQKNGATVELFKEKYVGNSFYSREKLR